jgi:kinesin family protein 2/24
VREDGRGEVHVSGLEEITVGTPAELLGLIAAGNRARTTQATASNDTSSRSHAICQVTLRRSPALPCAFTVVCVAWPLFCQVTLRRSPALPCAFTVVCVAWPLFGQVTLRRSSGRLLGKLSLVDLAGSERGNDSKSHSRQLRTESAEINKSLLALKE